jgi:hypothetical protein
MAREPGDRRRVLQALGADSAVSDLFVKLCKPAAQVQLYDFFE